MPRLSFGVLAAVFVGAFFGGLARYVIGRAVATPANAFPWDIFVINLAGAFALAVLLVLVLDVLPPTRYVRPALGTGFLGAFTTFSSLANSTDHLLAHGRPGLAVAYALGSLGGGIVCAAAGLVAGRVIGVYRHRVQASRGASR